MKKLSNTEAELKNALFIKKACNLSSTQQYIQQLKRKNQIEYSAINVL